MRRLPSDVENEQENEFYAQCKANALVGLIEWWIREDHRLTVEEMATNTMTVFLKNK